MQSKLTLFTLGISLFIMSSCGNYYKYWDVSKFKIVENALTDNEAIKVIYTSRGPDYNQDLKYYIHVIVISQKTGDTVNILTIANNGFESNDQNMVYNYFNMNNSASKMIVLSRGIVDEKNQSDEEVNKILSKINKVARDPDFDDIADNNFPTVIGTIGTYTKSNEE